MRSNLKENSMQRIIFLAFSFIAMFSFVVKSQVQQPVKVKWLTIQEAEKLCKENPKKILIDMYTDWCGWCKVMDKNTFSNPEIAEMITQNYYAVKFNAETKDTIMFNGKQYVNNGVGTRPTHSLAIELMRGQMSYPTILYMDEKLNVITPVPGYQTPEQIQPILLFFGQDVYKQQQFEKFTANFNKTFKDSIPTPDVVKWYTLEEAEKLQKKSPKKMLIHLYAEFNPMSRIMQKTTYNNPEIAKYLNDNYYPVVFNVLSKDSVIFGGKTFINEGKEHPFHQLAVSLLQGKMQFPQAVFVGEEGNLLSMVPGYMAAEIYEPVLYFFQTDAFKALKYEEFVKTFQGKVK